MSPCNEFNGQVTLKEDDEFVMVNCSVDKKEVYSNIHARLIKKEAAEEKTKRTKINDDQLSVLILGLDSMSRLNLMRTMPNTVHFLKEKNFINLKGYNKVGENTFPNFIAFLSGMTPDQYKYYCTYEDQDNCPLIWFDASKLGYVTQYAEDCTTLSTFNLFKGFRMQPTDYYMRPFILAAARYTKLVKMFGFDVCYGHTLTSEHMLNYARDFMRYYKNNLYFSLIWINGFSHDNINFPSAMDDSMFAFFYDLFKDNELLNRTAVIFLSDHGLRYDDIRKTYVGWYEERLPFIHIWLPDWYRNKFKTRYNNLITNSDRLTSPFDLHLTIKDLITLPSNDELKQYMSEACPDCVSLFKQVPWKRSCEDAGIPEQWCTCTQKMTLPIEGDLNKAMVLFAVKEINNMLEKSKHLVINNFRCAEFSVERIVFVQKPMGKESMYYRGEYSYYRVMFETLPGHAMFETTIRSYKKRFKIIGSISRINTYSNQSICILDAVLRNYCFCVAQPSSNLTGSILPVHNVTQKREVIPEERKF